MSPKSRYQDFLKSTFWRNLSRQKRRMVGACERCGDTKYLQAHHLFYRDDWYDTKLEDLQVLCRTCHLYKHGNEIKRIRIIQYRDDRRFNRFVHYLRKIWLRMFEDNELKKRELNYCHAALRMYPPTDKDQRVKTYVDRVLDQAVW